MPTAYAMNTPVPASTPVAPSSRASYLYLLPIVLAPFLLLVAAIWIIPSRWAILRTGNDYLINIGYGTSLRGANCQVLVYGDSAAMIGIDPGIVERRTGLSACNIAEFAGMTILNGTGIVDSYLAHNTRPKYMVFLYTPEMYNPESQRNIMGQYEAITYLMGQPGKLAHALKIFKNPSSYFTWAEQGLRFSLEKSLSRPASAKVQNLRGALKGRLPINLPTLQGCSPDPRPQSVPDRDLMSHLRSKYGTDGTTVFLDAVPVPPCDPQLHEFQRNLSGLIDNGIQTLPVEDYVASGRLHTNQAGVMAISNRLADQILLAEAHNSTPGRP